MKYKSEHSKLTCTCPPEDSFENKSLTAYRWVHEDIEHENNFKPVLLINPSRIDDIDSCEQKCNGYGLSLFIDEKKAERKLKAYLERKPKLKKVFGNSIAKGEIDDDDGVVDEPNKQGHFTLHESESCNLEDKFVIAKTLTN